MTVYDDGDHSGPGRGGDDDGERRPQWGRSRRRRRRWQTTTAATATTTEHRGRVRRDGGGRQGHGGAAGAGSFGRGLAPPRHVVSAGRDQPMVTTHEFDDVFRSSYPRLVRLLTATTDDAELAADCVQEAFVRAHVRWRRIGEYDDPVGWVRRVALNLARDHARRAARKRKAKHRLAVEVRPRSGQRAGRAAGRPPGRAAQPPDAAARTGGPPLRRGPAVREVASEMGLSEGAVKFHLHGGRERLRRTLEGVDEEGSGHERARRRSGPGTRAIARHHPGGDPDAALAAGDGPLRVWSAGADGRAGGRSLAAAAVVAAVWLGHGRPARRRWTRSTRHPSPPHRGPAPTAPPRHPGDHRRSASTVATSVTRRCRRAPPLVAGAGHRRPRTVPAGQRRPSPHPPRRRVGAALRPRAVLRPTAASEARSRCGSMPATWSW